jgi:hypothetical protein
MPQVHCEGGAHNLARSKHASLTAVNEDEAANNSLAALPHVQPALPPLAGPAAPDSSVEGEAQLPSHHEQALLPSVQVDQAGPPSSARHSSSERLGAAAADVNALNLSALKDSTRSSSGRESFGSKDSGRLEDGGSDLFYEGDDGLEQKQTLQGLVGLLFFSSNILLFYLHLLTLAVSPAGV